MAGQEPVALNLRTLTATIHHGDDAVPYLTLTDGDNTVELRPCAGGASPEALEGVDAAIHELGYLWELLRQRLHAQLLAQQTAGEQG